MRAYYQNGGNYYINKSRELRAGPYGSRVSKRDGDSKVVSAVSHWMGDGDPGFRNVIESIIGSVSAVGHARFDFFCDSETRRFCQRI